jgi:hypothetical protein
LIVFNERKSPVLKAGLFYECIVLKKTSVPENFSF